MFKKIMIPLDGSPLSEVALPVAEEFLDQGNAEATLFIVSDEPQPTRRKRAGLQQPVPIGVSAAGPNIDRVLPAAPPRYAESKGQAVDRVEHELLEYLTDRGRSLAKLGNSVDAAVRIGEPAKEIIAFAKRERFDLIVMATHGRSGLQKTLHGSVTSEVIRSGVAPVLVVRPKNGRRRKS